VRDFYVLGRGTLAPWDPPRRLVVRGLYRYSRNPMYLGVLCIVGGWAIGFQSTSLGLYCAGLLAAFHLRVILAEEPFLARTHGEEWTEYVSRVRRWL
jgi:protein-S-isoprenylcysteine O-methyltransferase Ste14